MNPCIEEPTSESSICMKHVNINSMKILLNIRIYHFQSMKGFHKADFDTKKCTGIVTGCDLTKSFSQVDNWLDITPVIDSFPHLAYQGSDDKSAKYIVLTEHRSKVLL